MISHRIVLHFPQNLVNQPIISKLAKIYNLEFNILKAYVIQKEEGLMVLDLSGEEKSLLDGIEYLKKSGVRIQPLSRDVIRDEEKCTHCSMCTSICPTQALEVDMLTRYVNFYSEKCIACELCVKSCPYGAMQIKF